ncbi:MAG: hypothetical protein ACKV2Q_33635, partial [Planctomycetaceae bacterium]
PWGGLAIGGVKISDLIPSAAAEQSRPTDGGRLRHTFPQHKPLVLRLLAQSKPKLFSPKQNFHRLQSRGRADTPSSDSQICVDTTEAAPQTKVPDKFLSGLSESVGISQVIPPQIQRGRRETAFSESSPKLHPPDEHGGKT